MISGLISFLVLALVLCVVYYIVRLLAQHFGLPTVVVQIAGLILALILVIALLQLAGALPHGWGGVGLR